MEASPAERELFHYIADEILAMDISYNEKNDIVFSLGNVSFTYEGRGHAVAQEKMFIVLQGVVEELVTIFVKRVSSFYHANRKNLN